MSDKMSCHNICIGVPCGYFSRASDLRCSGCERINIVEHRIGSWEPLEPRPLTMTPETENNAVAVPSGEANRYPWDAWGHANVQTRLSRLDPGDLEGK